MRGFDFQNRFFSLFLSFNVCINFHFRHYSVDSSVKETTLTQVFRKESVHVQRRSFIWRIDRWTLLAWFWTKLFLLLISVQYWRVLIDERDIHHLTSMEFSHRNDLLKFFDLTKTFFLRKSLSWNIWTKLPLSFNKVVESRLLLFRHFSPSRCERTSPSTRKIFIEKIFWR